MRSPSHQDNNFPPPSSPCGTLRAAAGPATSEDAAAPSASNDSNDPDDRSRPISSANTCCSAHGHCSHNHSLSHHFNNISAALKSGRATHSNVSGKSASTTSTTAAHAVACSDGSYSDGSSSDGSSSPPSSVESRDFDSYPGSELSSSTATPSSGEFHARSKLSSILSTSRGSSKGTSTHSPPLFLRKHPNDKSSSDGVDIDSMIKKLIFLNTANGKSAKHKHDKFPFHAWEIQLVCAAAREVFLRQPTLLRLQAPIKIVGDMHGQFNDLLRVLKLSGVPADTNYLFLGDYVDRGKQSLETILLLLCYKVKYPNNFFMLRGNHESASVTKMYGFYDECKRRKSTRVWKTFIDVFNCLPLAATINDKIFCVHGGISPELRSLSQINKQVVRPTDIPDSGLVTDLLWSDPDSSVRDWSDNDRGVSYTFSKSNVLDFCARFKFDLIIRGHMVVEDGYEFFARKKLVTVFSAPNYCGQFQNWGAVLAINTGLMCSFELLKPHQLAKRAR